MPARSSTPAPPVLPVTVLDKSVSDLRAVARCMTLSRERGDELCEETLLAFLSGDPLVKTDRDYLTDFFRCMRPIYGSGMFVSEMCTERDPALRVLSRLPLARREIAALHLGGGRSSQEIAAILNRDVASVAAEIAQFAQALIAAYAQKPYPYVEAIQFQQAC